MFKKSVVIRARRLKMPVKKTDYKSIIFFSLFICGIIFGTALSQMGSDSWHLFFDNLINKHLIAKSGNSLFVNFCGVFSWFILFLLYEFIFGLCAIGTPFLYLNPVFLGIYSGVCVCQYYNAFSLAGLGYCAVVTVPCYAIIAATLIRCCCYSKELSNYILLSIINPKTERKESILKEYALKYAVMVIPIGVGSFINALFFKLFGELFNLI